MPCQDDREVRSDLRGSDNYHLQARCDYLARMLCEACAYLEYEHGPGFAKECDGISLDLDWWWEKHREREAQELKGW